MARLRQQYTVAFSVDSTAEEMFLELKPSQFESTDVMTGGGSDRRALAHGGSFTITPPSAAKFVYISANKLVTVRLDTADGQGTAFPVKPQSTSFPGRLILFTDGITAIVVANPGSTSTDDGQVTFAFGV